MDIGTFLKGALLFEKKIHLLQLIFSTSHIDIPDLLF